MKGPVRCYGSCDVLGVNTSGTVLVDAFGLSIIEHRSVVTFESALFGSEFRGYLIVFPYVLVNGPDLSLPPLLGHRRLNGMVMSYTDDHMVRTFSFIDPHNNW